MSPATEASDALRLDGDVKAGLYGAASGTSNVNFGT